MSSLTTPDEVLKKFTDLCNNHSELLQYNLASNSVLEWFGRTFRGGKTIHQYYRYDLCEQYEHNFIKARNCSPFEVKTSHMQTTTTPPENLLEKVNHPTENLFASGSTSSNGFSTPPQIRRSPQLPPLTQGRKFTNLTDDEDESDDEEDSKTLNNLLVHGIKKIKTFDANLLDNDDDDDDDDDGDEQLKITIDTSNFGIKKYSTELFPCKITTGSKRILPMDNETELKKVKNDFFVEEIKHEIENKYSELIYLEAVGMIRMMRKSKHRGVTSSNFQSGSSTTNDIQLSDSALSLPIGSNNYWERSTRLKLSYRIRREDNDIQFALIIYEHVTKNPATRRNLMVEFKSTKSRSSEKIKNHLKSDKKVISSSKKSLRF